MSTQTFDESLAHLASLLEADLSVCRSALEQAGGDVEGAIRVMFEGEAGRSSSSSSAACFAIDLDDDEELVPLPRGRVVTLQPIPKEEEFWKEVEERDALMNVHESPVQMEAASNMGESCDQKETVSTVLGLPEAGETVQEGWAPGENFDDLHDQGNEAPVMETCRKRPGESDASTAPPLKQAKSDFTATMLDQWTSHNLKQKVIHKMATSDPPSLTLQGQKPESLPEVSSGDLHKVTENMHKVIGNTDVSREGKFVQVKTSWLDSCFSDLLESVRYAPVKLECSWKVVNLTSAGGSFRSLSPYDLRGPIPHRPFTLLNNSDDEPASQPPRFTEHQLRPEQLRSLSWMLEQESADDTLFPVEWRRFMVPESFGEDPDGEQVVNGSKVRLRPHASGPFFKAGTLESLQPHEMPNTKAGKVEKVSEFGSVSVAFPSGRASVAMRVICQIGDLEWIEDGPFSPGCRVRVSSTVKNPQFGWGGVTRNTVGILLQANRANDTVQVKFPSHHSWKGRLQEIEQVKETSQMPFSPMLELRVMAYYDVKGGILADKIGYGKTATTIGLIDSTLNRPVLPVPSCDNNSFLPAKGTLIIVPSNLYDQWIQEISKFVWKDGTLRGNFKGGWSPPNCPWKIFAMSNVKPLRSVTAAQICDADVVICSYRLLFSEIYKARRAGLSGSKKSLFELVQVTKKLMTSKAPLPNNDKDDTYAHVWSELQFPVLEMFYWNRIVFDEFHELECFDALQQNSLQHLRARHRWGLTGTPPVDCTAGVIFMSSLFRVDIPGNVKVMGNMQVPDLSPWESDKLVTGLASRFLDRCCRQNTADLPHIRLEEHIVPVNHTPTERALYLGQAHDAPDINSEDAFKNENNVKALVKLLTLCSHFQASGDNSVNASEEVSRISEQKERRVVKAQNQVSRCARVLLLLDGKLSTKDSKWQEKLLDVITTMQGEGDNDASCAQFLKEELTSAQRESPFNRVEVLEGHRAKEPQLLEIIGQPEPRIGHTREQWYSLASKTMSQEQAEALLEGQVQEQLQNLQELRDATSSLGFFTRTVKALQHGSSGEARSCSVCLEEDLPLSKLAITKCAHTFCLECLRMTVQKFKHCSICRGDLSLKDIRPVAQEMEPSTTSSSTSTSPGAPASSSVSHSNSDMSEEDVKYGTKLGMLVRKLRELKTEDSSAKVILFCQFDDLKRKVMSALREFGIGVTVLQGGVNQRANIIYEWQNNAESASWVLMLSLTQCASGTNLTAANHVVFLHPMLAATAERAVDHELQAIGRARRHGQRSDVVHVWRFVAQNTIEQAITEKHRASLATAG